VFRRFFHHDATDVAQRHAQRHFTSAKIKTKLIIIELGKHNKVLISHRRLKKNIIADVKKKTFFLIVFYGQQNLKIFLLAYVLCENAYKIKNSQIREKQK